jgi:NAD-dependent SIR2 family protein deacetylase
MLYLSFPTAPAALPRDAPIHKLTRKWCGNPACLGFHGSVAIWGCPKCGAFLTVAVGTANDHPGLYLLRVCPACNKAWQQGWAREGRDADLLRHQAGQYERALQIMLSKNAEVHA